MLGGTAVDPGASQSCTARTVRRPPEAPLRTVPARPLALLAALGVAAALAGCAGGDDGAATAPGDEPAPSSVPQESLTTPSPSLTTSEPASGEAGDIGPVDLTAVVDDGAGGKTTYTLTCEPTGGDVEQPEVACEQLSTTAALPLQPVDPDMMCTQVYGGPQTAVVTGTVNGQPVDSTFSRVNGCEISRWDAMTALLGVVDADS
jgi:hypothetical protein